MEPNASMLHRKTGNHEGPPGSTLFSIYPPRETTRIAQTKTSNRCGLSPHASILGNVNPGLINPWLFFLGGCPLLVGVYHFWRKHPPNDGTGLCILGQHYPDPSLSWDSPTAAPQGFTGRSPRSVAKFVAFTVERRKASHASE